MIAPGTGSAKYTQEFDSPNRRIGVAYLGTDGKPLMSRFGYASATWDYDHAGNVINAVKRGVDGEPLPDK
jgi:hypothetical protein